MKQISLLKTCFVIGIALTELSSPSMAGENVRYESDILPLIKAYCTKCHNNTSSAGGLNLETFPFSSLFMGDEDQAKIVAKLLRRVKDPRYPMPPGGGLPEQAVFKLQTWLDQGLPP